MVSLLFVCLQNHNKKVKVAESWHDKLKTYSVGPGCQSAFELYSEIDRKLPDYYSVCLIYIRIFIIPKDEKFKII